VVVHAGPSFDADRRPLRLVFFLHGWTGCARVLVEAGPSRCREGDRVREGWALGTRFDAAGTDALFVVPQLAFMQRDGSAGRFAERGRFRAFVEELLAALEPRVGRVGLSEVEPVTLLAHSAGFETALAVLTRGEVDVRHVVLFDALYRGVEPFSGWVEGRDDRRLVSLFTGTERTASQNELLARRARLSIPRSAVLFADPPRPLADAIRPHRVVIARSPAGHASVPARHLAEVIEGLGLRTRP
jgi:pimeloyl-ACP methyl ester carboxylesterase